MASHRDFLDWDTPALPAAVGWLAGRHTRDGVLDLSGQLLVLPGARAGRRLLELLVDHAAAQSLRLVPPTTLTVGALPEQLYVSQKPFADDLVQRCAWVTALQESPAETLENVCNQQPGDDPRGWIELADLLRRQHRELAGDGLNFADVANCEMLDSLPRERRRWEILHEIQRRYLDTLEDLSLWDRQTARLVAIELNECHAPCDIILIGTVDINHSTRQMLESEHVADRITALVHAPENLADRFDQLGCLVPLHWRQPAVPPADHVVQVADRPDDQAAAVAAWLSRLPGPLRADDITLGIADESLVPVVARQMADCHVATRWVQEAALSETRPWRLLETVADCLASVSVHDSGAKSTADQDGSDDDGSNNEPRLTFAYEPLAALWRHPDFNAWLQDQLDPDHDLDSVMALDNYRSEHLAASIELPRQLDTTGDAPGTLQRSLHLLFGLLDPLFDLEDSPVRPLSEWAVPLTRLLSLVYAGRQVDRDDRNGHVLLAASRHIQKAIGLVGEVPTAVAPNLDVIEAIRLALESAAGETIPARAEPDAIEMVGWLELPLDDAPVLAIVGVNEGQVPSSATSDLFLPDRLRHRLGILDNTRRIARDAYAVSALTATHDHLLLVGGRQTDNGDPMRPSRLLLAAEEGNQPARVLRLLDAPPDTKAARLPGAFASEPTDSKFRVPPPTTAGLNRVGVTAFGDYLECPYRFYLKHVLKLKSVDDQSAELTALSFGNLAHDALDDFGKSDLAGSTNLEEVCEFLKTAAWRWTWRRHGQHRPEAVDVQVTQLNDRLEAFAAWHVASVSDGWRITHTEESIGEGRVILDTPAGGLSVTGRIDRIDRHEDTGQWRVIDYKTSNAANPPEKVHRRGSKNDRQWVNLQLPLYRRLVREALGVDGDVQLGFMTLPTKLDDTGFLPAEWSDAELVEADTVIDQVAESIVRGKFDRIASKPPAFSDDWARICQDHLPHLPRHEHWSQP